MLRAEVEIAVSPLGQEEVELSGDRQRCFGIVTTMSQVRDSVQGG